ncbi:Conidiation protein 6-domain-containing protein [Vararia minispora EC-137]|uniref:Conidiation protein 6-domain-containing protein n=1 Tax=Vararia minispora EC-137 TaxID=1314806 RepID=A0ACB8QXM6_9AGAM|nr:Conidiation protein 6-domain-containing protein [Vararia minispora EC-137]
MSEQNVARGHKANLSNPNTSEESKEHSEQVLSELEDRRGRPDQQGSEGRDSGNVLRGYKASISNPGVSEEAKEHARDVLRDNDALDERYE